MNLPKKGLLVAMLMALASACSYAAEATCGLRPTDAERLRAVTQDLVARGHAPGAVIDVRCKGQPWLELAVGVADVARAKPMQTDSIFRIYSMTKPLTSLLVMMLAEDGALSIDDPLARYLPEFDRTVAHDGSASFPPATVPLRRPLTLRDLLRHTAGMTYISAEPDPVTRMYVLRGIDHGAGRVIVPADGSPPVASLADLTQRLAAIPLLAQPGQRFTYGNATDVLGRVVEVVAGKPLREVMKQRIFQPLEMRDTSFEVSAEQVSRLTAAYAAAAKAPRGPGLLSAADMNAVPSSAFTLVDDPAKSVFASRRPVDFGGAGLVSTTQDYQRLLHLLVEGGQTGNLRLIRRDAVVAMTHNQVDAAALKGTQLERSGLGFGLGFATFDAPERAPAALPLGGYFWGGAASTYFWVDPARGITGVLMTQVFGGDVGPYFMRVMDTLYKPQR